MPVLRSCSDHKDTPIAKTACHPSKDISKLYDVYLPLSTKKRYIMYTGDDMKKTEFITFRTDKETKETLETIAATKKWTVSLLTEEIIKDWLQHHQEHSAGECS